MIVVYPVPCEYNKAGADHVPNVPHPQTWRCTKTTPISCGECTFNWLHTVGRLIGALWHLAFLLVWASIPCKYSSIGLNLMKYDIFNNFGPSILKKFQFFKNLPLCVTQKTSFLTSKFAIFWKIVPFFLYFVIYLNGSCSCMI